MSGTAYGRLRALGLELPPVPPPRGAFKPFSRSGTLVFLAGQICEWDGEVRFAGQIGVVHEGQFVPFAVLDDQTFEDAKSRAAPSEPDEEAPAEGEGGE